MDGTHKLNKNVVSKQTGLKVNNLPAVEYESRDGSIYRIIQIDTPDNTYSFALDVSGGMTEEHVEKLRMISKSFKSPS